MPNRAVFKSKQKQILDNYEQECNDSNQSPGQKASSAANVYENANDNLDNKDDNNENIKINGILIPILKWNNLYFECQFHL